MTSLPEKATHRRTRVFNQRLVLRAIYDRSAVSRADVARLTSLTRTTVSQLVGELLRDGLVEEIGRGPSTGGKAPILLQVRAHGRHLIGLDLGESTFSGAVVDLRGNILRSLSLPLVGRNGREAVELVYELIDALTRSNGDGPLLGIGIGAPGLIDSRTGVVRWSVNLDWADLALGQLVERRFNTPVVVANDSQAAAVAELMFGGQPRPRNLVVVRIGRGVGAGVILNGHLFQGDGSGAGEIGHTIFDNTGHHCRCGRTGCLETVVSVPAMVAAAHAADPLIVDYAALVAAFTAGRPEARDIVLHAGAMLGRAVSALIGALNVNHVMFIGPVTELGADWLAAVRAEAVARSLPQLGRDICLELGVARENDVVLGASALLMTVELGLSLTR